MQNLDSTAVATALPAMARTFGADPLHMNVALTSYLLSLAVFVPASGWAADRFGARTTFRVAIAVFTLGSVLCGRAESLHAFVAARVLQGMGGAMMVPVGRLLLLRTAAKSELVAAMAWLTIPSLIGPVVGPPLGGIFVTYADWRWIFGVNVPIGLLGIVLVTRYIADVREPGPARLDAWGFVLSGVALSGLMLGFETAGRGLLPPAAVAALLAVGGVALLAYLRHARRVAEPILDLGLMRIPTFAVSVVSGSLFRVGIGGVPFLLPLMLQIGFGQSAVQSGFIVLSGSLGALAMKPAAQAVLRRFGFRAALVWNGVFSALLLGACAAFRPGWPVVALYAVLLIGGFLRSLQFTAYNTIAYADVPRPRMGAATALYATVQQLSLTLGISAGAAALQSSAALSGRTTPAPADFSAAFLAVSFVALLASPTARRLAPDAGAELSGHGPTRSS